MITYHPHFRKFSIHFKLREVGWTASRRSLIAKTMMELFDIC